MTLQLPERFEALERIGAGASGVVYRVFDRRRNAELAVKALKDLDAQSLYRFKQEFRRLARIDHPNLVKLYELLAEDGAWFITMEFVRGCDFLSWVRGDKALDAAPRGVDLARLVRAAHGLAVGVAALHDAGALHRDLRPSNVKVGEDERIVLLDFGLATALGPDAALRSTSHGLVGTPAYMSPEQTTGGLLGPASDWYGFGVMLYEALTGRVPFLDGDEAPAGPDASRTLDEAPTLVGTPRSGGHESDAAPDWLRLVLRKRDSDPPPPAALAPRIPQDLDRLCTALLCRDPAGRPGAAEILETLEKLAGGAVRAWRVASPDPAALLFGRDAEIAELERAFADARSGRGVGLAVRGRSGIGKSALVAHVLDGLAERGEAIVLRGRCYEREAVAYKALDAIVDAGASFLRRLSTSQVSELLPRNASALVRTFPVLAGIQAFAGAPERGLEALDPVEQRTRAFAALRELLTRTADRRPLVLWVDDLQWGDLDSVSFLAELLAPPDPPALLLVLSFREEDVDSSPVLAQLLAGWSRAGAGDVRELRLGALGPPAAVELVTNLLEGRPLQRDAALIRSITRESGGVPYFLREFVQYLHEVGEDRHAEAARVVRLEDVLISRVMRLPAAARRLLELVAVSGRPIERQVVARAAGLASHEPSALNTLTSAHLVRVRTARGVEELETYHDRLRETVLQHLSDGAAADLHRALAEALERSGRRDPQALALHLAGAGERERAASFAEQAAADAFAALSFDQAARMYRMALELRGAPHSPALLQRLGDALVHAGRCAEGAHFLLEAAAGADRRTSLTLRQRAAENMLLSGHVDEGIEGMESVLESVGMRLPPSNRRAVLSLLLNRLRLRVRGIRFAPQPERQVPDEELLRLDMCWSVAAGLSMVDLIRSSDYQARYLLQAMKSGDPRRISVGISLGAGMAAVHGGRRRSRSDRLTALARESAQKSGAPHALGLAELAFGLVSELSGEFRDALGHCNRADEIFRERCALSSAAWERTTANRFALGSLMYMGDLRQLEARARSLIAEARERGNLWASTDLRTRFTHLIWLAADDPGGARDEIENAMRDWSHRGYHLQHFHRLVARGQTDLYEGRTQAAWERIQAEWGELKRSFILRVQLAMIEARFLRGRAALALHGERPEPALLRAAERDAAAIARERMAWADPIAELLRAGLAATRGRDDDALARLRRAVSGFEAAEMALFAAVARRRLGELVGGDEGAERTALADRALGERGVRDPTRLASLFAPGFGAAA